MPARAGRWRGTARWGTCGEIRTLPSERLFSAVEIIERFPGEIRRSILFRDKGNLNTGGIHGKGFTYRDDLTPAGSFSQTFKRNAFNNGHIVVECPDLVTLVRARFGSRNGPTVRPGVQAVVGFERSEVRFDGRTSRFRRSARSPKAWWLRAASRRCSARRSGPVDNEAVPGAAPHRRGAGRSKETQEPAKPRAAQPMRFNP